MKIVLLTIGLWITFKVVEAQYLAPAILSAGSNETTANGRSVSYTIGQFAVFTVHKKQPGIVSEFYSSTLITSPVRKEPLANMDVKVYPNPTAQMVNISLNKIEKTDNEIFSISIFDMIGRDISLNMGLKNKEFHQGDNINIDLNSAAAGQYLIRIASKQNSTNIATFKVIKQF